MIIVLQKVVRTSFDIVGEDQKYKHQMMAIWQFHSLVRLIM